MQSSIASLLQLETRSGSLSPDGRCISISWAGKIPYLFPPFRIGRTSLVEDPQRSSQSCMLGSASMTISDLVFTIARHVSRPILMLLPMEDNLLLNPDQRSHPLQLERKLMLDHLAYLRQYLETQVLSQRAAVLVTESWRDNTLLITQPAISGIAGVLNWISIPFRSVVSTGTIFGRPI